MKKFKNFNQAFETVSRSGGSQLPTGGYICEIKNVQFVEGQNGTSDRINLLYDVVEGEQKDFFKKQYESNTADDKKWKGRCTVWCPTDDDEDWKQNAFARWPLAIEKSNSGYSWDWDESKWKGKKIGLIVGPTGSVDQDGKEFVYNEVHGCCSVDEIKKDSFYKKNLELVKKKGYTGNGGNTSVSNDGDFVNIADGIDEEIPFE